MWDDLAKLGAPPKGARQKISDNLGFEPPLVRGPDTCLDDPANRGLASMHDGLDLDHEKGVMIAKHLTTGTRTGYDYKWSKWELFSRLRKQSEYLEYDSRIGMRKAEA